MRPRDVDSDLTAKRLREIVRYDPETGKFYWLKGNNQKQYGDEAGSLENTGYLRITVDGRRYVAHRLAWLYVYGGWPKEQIDHENLNRSDNRFCNLRPSDNSTNRANTKPRGHLGVKGVSLHVSGRYHARIMKGQKSKSLGLFSTIQEASSAYEKAARESFGEFARIR